MFFSPILKVVLQYIPCNQNVICVFRFQFSRENYKNMRNEFRGNGPHQRSWTLYSQSECSLGPLQLIIPVLQKRHTGRQGKEWPFYDVSLFALNSSQWMWLAAKGFFALRIQLIKALLPHN